MNTKIVKLDINKKLYDKIQAKQGDTKSRFLLFHLLDGAVQFSLVGRTVRVYGLKPDNKEFFNDLQIVDVNKGYCKLELTSQALAVPGDLDLELVIMEGESKLSSIPFVVEVIKSLNSKSAIESSNEYKALDRSLTKVEEWNNEFADKSGKLEQLYTERLNGLGTQLAEKAKQVDLNTTNTKVNNLEITVESNTSTINQIAEKGTTVEVLERVTKEEIDRQVADGTIANLTIKPNSITNDKYKEESITVNKVDFIKRGKNIFDKNDKNIVVGSALTGSGTIVGGYPTLMVTGFMECLPETTYEPSPTKFTVICYYDKNENFISSETPTTNSFRTPANCYKVRGSLLKTKREVLQVEVGEATSYEAYGLNKKYMNDDSINHSILKDGIVTNINDINWYNIEEYQTYIKGTVIGFNGELFTLNNDKFSHTEIEVLGNEIYQIGNYGNPDAEVGGVFIDESGNGIGLVKYRTTDSDIFITPSNAKKLILNIHNSFITNGSFFIKKFNGISIPKNKHEINKMLGNHISNLHWAELQDEFSYKDGQFVQFSLDKGVEYKSNIAFKYSQEIPVKPGEVWQVVDKSITPESNWNARGIFLNGDKFAGNVPYERLDDYVNVFMIPMNVTSMILNRRNDFKLLKCVDFENVFDKNTSVYVLNKIVNNSGEIVTNNNCGYIELDVSEGEVYRIADTQTGDGSGLNARGVFKSADGVTIKPIKVNTNAPYAWNDVIVPPSATKMYINFVKEIQSEPNAINHITINRATEPIIKYADNSKFRMKKWCAIGDSITWYGDWEQLVCNATNLIYYNYGLSSGSIAMTSRNINILTDERLDEIIALNPHIISIMGGVNDKAYNVPLGNESDLYATYGTEDRTTFIGSYAYAIKKLLQSNPKLQIVIMSPSSVRNDEPNSIGLQAIDYANAARKVAEYFSRRFIDIRARLGLNNYNMDVLTRDNVHWSFRGTDCGAQEVDREFRSINWMM